MSKKLGKKIWATELGQKKLIFRKILVLAFNLISASISAVSVCDVSDTVATLQVL